MATAAEAGKRNAPRRQDAPAPVALNLAGAEGGAEVSASSGTSRSWWWSSQPDPPSTVKYGPNGCVSTYKSKENHCIMRTKCAAESIKDYEFGLICVDADGAPVRHLFGKDSFDPEEVFDTLIVCDQCLGLENIPDTVAMNGQVLELSKEVRSLQKMMTGLASSVSRIENKVFTTTPAAAVALSVESRPQVAAQQMQTAVTRRHRRARRAYRGHHIEARQEGEEIENVAIGHHVQQAARGRRSGRHHEEAAQVEAEANDGAAEEQTDEDEERHERRSLRGGQRQYQQQQQQQQEEEEEEDDGAAPVAEEGPADAPEPPAPVEATEELPASAAPTEARDSQGALVDDAPSGLADADAEDTQTQEGP